MKYDIIDTIPADKRWVLRQGIWGWLTMGILSIAAAVACSLLMQDLAKQVVVLCFCLFLSLQFFWIGTIQAIRASTARIYVTRQGQLLIRHLRLREDITIAPQDIQLSTRNWLLATEDKLVQLPKLAYPFLPRQLNDTLEDLKLHPERPSVFREV